MTANSNKPLNTVGTIAERLGVPVHRVEYFLRSRNLQPESRAGQCRIYSDEQVELIARELQQIQSRRTGGQA